jgi:pyridoxine kinase
MNFLSIQSHVAYGYVGNRAATFPLQRMGHDVWAVNTVAFSNHTGYGSWKGAVAPVDEVQAVLTGIEERGVLPDCDAVLTGYLGDAARGEVILGAVAKVRAANARAVWCCDPVIGDRGRGVFVRPGITEFFRDRALTSCDIATPNHFELELLTGRTVASLAEALDASRTLMARGPKLVLVTSLHRGDAPAGTIEMLAATASEAWLVATPMIDFAVPPHGTGDAVAALFTAHFLASGHDPGAALSATAAAIYAVLDATRRAGTRELQIVSAQDAFVSAERPFTARAVA